MTYKIEHILPHRYSALGLLFALWKETLCRIGNNLGDTRLLRQQGLVPGCARVYLCATLQHEDVSSSYSFTLGQIFPFSFPCIPLSDSLFFSAYDALMGQNVGRSMT